MTANLVSHRRSRHDEQCARALSECAAVDVDEWVIVLKGFEVRLHATLWHVRLDENGGVLLFFMMSAILCTHIEMIDDGGI
jgi:hypothetical protein